MQLRSYIIFHSFGLPHTGCMTGYSGPTNHSQKFLLGKGKRKFALATHLMSFQVTQLSWSYARLSTHRQVIAVQSPSPSGPVMEKSSTGQPMDMKWEESVTGTSQTSKRNLMLCEASNVGRRVAPIPCQLCHYLRWCWNPFPESLRYELSTISGSLPGHCLLTAW